MPGSAAALQGETMSRDLNKAMVTGRLGRDPKPQYLNSGNVVSTFTVASNRKWRDHAGELHDAVEWFTVVTWNQLAEFCNDRLRKGHRIFVEGRLQTRTWKNSSTGQTQYRTELIADDLILLDPRTDGIAGAGAASPEERAAPRDDVD